MEAEFLEELLHVRVVRYGPEAVRYGFCMVLHVELQNGVKQRVGWIRVQVPRMKFRHDNCDVVVA